MFLKPKFTKRLARPPPAAVPGSVPGPTGIHNLKDYDSKILRKKKKKLKIKKKDRLLIFIKKWRIRYRWTVSLRIWYEERGKKLAKKIRFSGVKRALQIIFNMRCVSTIVTKQYLTSLSTNDHSFYFYFIFAGFADEI